MNDPRSELFLSCDLVSSTAYKQRQSARGSAPPGGRREEELPWQQVFLEFYQDFPRMLGEVRDARLGRDDVTIAHEPHFKLWKPIGDELVFTVRIEHEDTVYAAVRIWLEALNRWSERIRPLGMGTKGGAFIATFPGPDRDVAVPREAGTSQSVRGVVAANDDACSATDRSHDEFLFDYFGPSVDIGFRLFNKATPRRFSLSVEVAWVMFEAARENKKSGFWDVSDIEYMGGQELKGVWAGRDYPLFVIDRHHRDPINTATKVLANNQISLEQSVDLCRACVDDPTWPSAVYLPKGRGDSAKAVPTDPLIGLRVDNEMMGTEEALDDDALGDEGIPTNAPVG